MRQSDPVEPVRQRLAAGNRGCLASQDQKSRLESVLRLMRADQHAAANAEDHGAMPPHQHGKRLFGAFIPPADEPVQQLTVAEVSHNAEAEERPQVSECFPRRSARHEPISLALVTTAIYWRQEGGASRFLPDVSHYERMESYPTIACSDSRAAAIVWSMSASVWAAETKAASNWLHGRYTPRASISQKKRAKSRVSLRLASS